MDINQVRFQNYSIGNSGARAKKETKKEEQTPLLETKTDTQMQQSKSDNVLNALSLQGIQNKAQIIPAKKELDIDALLAKYSNPQSAKRIESMMNDFESNVNTIANTVETEFPGVFSKESKNAFAASIYAQG